MADKKSFFSILEHRIGYRFKNAGLLKQSLTHASARGECGGTDNERLEFLGDRVLGLCIAEMLFKELPQAREVELARNYNDLVRKESCADVARDLDLGTGLVLAASEARSGGRRKDVILADACEALLGAVMIDGGFDAVRQMVDKLWGPRLGQVRVEPDAKTALQEYAQSRQLGLPQYEEVMRSGLDHAPVFSVQVLVKGYDPAQGVGPSIKKAQQAAAEAFLLRESVWTKEMCYV